MEAQTIKTYEEYLKEYQAMPLEDIGTKWGDCVLPNSGEVIDFSKPLDDDELQAFAEHLNAIFPE